MQLPGNSKKRPYQSGVMELNRRGDVAEGQQSSSASATALQGSLCRPWDRGDFTRRLATFKSMSWFAKPKVISFCPLVYCILFLTDKGLFGSGVL